jgi:GTP-binding protein HflX
LEKVIQHRDSPDPATYLGKGKMKEIIDIALTLDADMIVFDDELTPAQGRNLEDLAGVNPLAERGLKIVDRTGLILDIFAQHARSSEGKLQVELAALTYRLPRLRGWGEVLSRLGGVGTSRGPGETQLEVDRRAILRRMQRVKKDLEDLERTRQLKRKQRKRNAVPVVALVGYTNAGKSTMLKRLTSEKDVLVQNQLFSTLDPTTRRMPLPTGHIVLITDTVGFVRKLPHQLVEAFRSTLEEVGEATMLLHVVDASGDVERQMDAVSGVLREMGVVGSASVVALNKADLLDEDRLADLKRSHPEAVICSAATGIGIEALLERIDEELAKLKLEVEMEVPFDRGEVVARVHEEGDVLEEGYTEAGTRLVARIPHEMLKDVEEFVTAG